MQPSKRSSSKEEITQEIPTKNHFPTLYVPSSLLLMRNT